MHLLDQFEIEDIQTLLSQIFNEQFVKTIKIQNQMFGYGLFHDCEQFGFYQRKRFYLKAEDDFVNILKKYGAVSWLRIQGELENPDLEISHYYLLPDVIMDNKSLCQKVFITSIKQVHYKKLYNKLILKSRIKELLNLTIKHERLLAKVNILTVRELLDIGAFKSFLLLRSKGLVTNLEPFWRLFAALQNKQQESLSFEVKQKALAKLNIMLTKAGLRAMKLKL